MSAVTVEHEHPALPGWQVVSEAEAGITLSDGERWWGTRVHFRKDGSRRWESVLLVDVHPFDTDTIYRFLGEYLTKRTA